MLANLRNGRDRVDTDGLGAENAGVTDALAGVARSRADIQRIKLVHRAVETDSLAQQQLASLLNIHRLEHRAISVVVIINTTNHAFWQGSSTC